MLRAMDEVLAFPMLLKGTTPQLMAAERQRQEEAEELCAREASQVKVQHCSGCKVLRAFSPTLSPTRADLKSNGD